MVEIATAWQVRAERFRGSAADESGMTAVEYGLLAALMGTIFLVAGPALWQGLLGLLDVVLGRMLS